MIRCKGCGVILQNTDKNKLGYVEANEQELCMRCFRLSHYGEYRSVELDNKDYQKILDNIDPSALVVCVTDILSLNLDIVDKFKNTLLVVTKKDILPKSVKDYKIIEYIKGRCNLQDVIIVSSNKNYNIDTLYNYLERYSDNDIYIVGNTNSGKSTLINRLISNYSDNNSRVTVSMYPSTTLDKIEIKIGKLKIIDTPGLIDSNNIINYIDKKSIKKITPKKEIKPRTCQIVGKGSIVIDDYVRIDYETDIKNSMVIYGAVSLNIRFNSYNKDNMKDLEKHTYELDGDKDIVIDGLCFIKFTKNIKVDIYTLEGVEPVVRDNLI